MFVFEFILVRILVRITPNMEPFDTVLAFEFGPSYRNHIQHLSVKKGDLYKGVLKLVKIQSFRKKQFVTFYSGQSMNMY